MAEAEANVVSDNDNDNEFKNKLHINDFNVDIF